MATFTVRDEKVSLQYDLKEVIEFDINAYFELPDDFNGEFGFDWFRQDLHDILDNDKKDKYKKEYTPEPIGAETEYKVPWLSLFEKQDNVKLMLRVVNNDESKSKGMKHEKILLPEQNGIKFDPEEIVLKDAIEAGKTEIKVECLKAGPDNTQVCVKLAELDRTVGKLNIFNNQKTYDLNFRIVKVVNKNESKKETEKKYLNEALSQIDLSNYFNNNSLQQAMIKTTIDDEDCTIEIDVDKLIAEKKIEGLKISKDFQDDILNVFLEEYTKNYEQNTKYKGLVIFLSALHSHDFTGRGQLWDAPARHCGVFGDALYRKSTYAHEVGHVLGLTHTFEYDADEDKVETAQETIVKHEQNKETLLSNINTNKKDIEKINQKIKSNEEKIAYFKKYPNNSNAIENIKKGNEANEKLRSMIVDLEKRLEENESKLIDTENKINHLKNEKIPQYKAIKERNCYIFPIKGTTKNNFMDYLSSGRSLYYKYQWLTMQKDIEEYYQKQTL